MDQQERSGRVLLRGSGRERSPVSTMVRSPRVEWKRWRAGARAHGRIRGPRQPPRRLSLIGGGIFSNRLAATVCPGNHPASGVEQSAFLRDADHPGHARQPTALSGRHRQRVGVGAPTRVPLVYDVPYGLPPPLNTSLTVYPSGSTIDPQW